MEMDRKALGLATLLAMAGPNASKLLSDALSRGPKKRWQCHRCGKLQRKDPTPEQEKGWKVGRDLCLCPACNCKVS